MCPPLALAAIAAGQVVAGQMAATKTARQQASARDKQLGWDYTDVAQKSIETERQQLEEVDKISRQSSIAASASAAAAAEVGASGGSVAELIGEFHATESLAKRDTLLNLKTQRLAMKTGMQKAYQTAPRPEAKFDWFAAALQIAGGYMAGKAMAGGTGGSSSAGSGEWWKPE